jgi:hypothetical protein
MNIAPHGYLDGNEHNQSQPAGRLRKADPLDHTYYIQHAGDTRRRADPRARGAAGPRYRATCDVCPWVGEWRTGVYPGGSKQADADGAEHRANSRGIPGWGHCPECGTRTADDALCDRHAQAYEDHITDQKDPWA